MNRPHRERTRDSICPHVLESLETRRLLAVTHLYDFNDNANDLVGTAHATLFNGAKINSGRLILQNAGLTSGSANAQYASLPNGILPASGSATVEVWYTAYSATPNWMRVFDFGDQTGSSGNSYLFYTPKGNGGDARAGIKQSGATEIGVSGVDRANHGYSQMAAVVVDTAANLLRLYVNGIEKGTASLNGLNIGTVNELNGFLGRSQFNSDSAFSGTIDELRIYDEALTAGAIQTHYDAGPAPITPVSFPKQVEKLNRGLVAVNRGGGSMYVGWRLLGTEPTNLGFNVYRSVNGGAFGKRNANVITNTTDYIDSGISAGSTYTYQVHPVLNGVEQEPSEAYSVTGTSVAQQFISVPLQIPPGGTTPAAEEYTYTANDVSVGDLDGDGDYEYIVKWEPTNAKDNSQSGYTGSVFIDAYTLEGTQLWRIDLGRNIRAGAHYTQFMVYDLDGDGKSEVAMKTAPGTVDGQGNHVLMGSDDPNADYRNTSGYILTGPEYLTVFNGLTGAAMASVPFEPARGSVSQWGDSYGNRVDRFTAGIAYLDGTRPSLIMARGYYGPQSGSGQARNEIAAYNWRDGQLTLVWHFKAGQNINNDINRNYIGQGPHGLSVGDVDRDGKDEIVYGAAVIDDDGSGLYSTELGHGDAFHLSDMDPNNPGLEFFMPHEGASSNGNVGSHVRDAGSGRMLVTHTATGDIGRGNAFDIDPRYAGYETWDTGQPDIYAIDGTVIQGKPSNMFINFGVWWDADPMRELLDGTTISDWRITSGSGGRSNFDLDPNSGDTWPPDVTSNNGTKSTPALSGDILGDWREEVIWRRGDNTALHIYTTTIAATSRVYTLMHDVQYREAIAWQNVAYNQPPHPSFFLGAADASGAMPAIPSPNIYLAEQQVVPTVTQVYPAETQMPGGGAFVETTNAGFNGGGYVNFPTTGGTLSFTSVNGGDGGNATIAFRYALASGTRTGTLSINGVSQPITFTATGAWTTWATHSVQVTLNPGAVNTIALQSTGQDLANIDEMQATVVDATAPQLVQGGHLFNVSPNAITLQFSENVSGSFSLEDVTIQSVPAGTSLVPTSYTFNPATNTFTLQLPVSIPDSHYVLTLNAAGITDSAGNPLTGSDTYNFWSLGGDANRDGAVNTGDFNVVAANFGLSGKTFSEGNLDGQGLVDSQDFGILIAQYGRKLLAPSAPLAAQITPVTAMFSEIETQDDLEPVWD